MPLRDHFEISDLRGTQSWALLGPQRVLKGWSDEILTFFTRIADAGRSIGNEETDTRARSRYSGCWRTIPGGGVADGLQRTLVPCRRDLDRTRHVNGRWSEASELR